MTLQHEPDVAFGVHPDLGVAAAVAVDRPSLDETLRKYHFRYSQGLDIYLLPDDTPHDTAVRTVARATREFQDAGLSVAADPRIMLPPPVPTADDVPAREPARGESLTALTSQLHGLRHSADVAEVLEEILDQHQGAVGDLEDFIDTAAAWCERLETPNGRELSLRLRTIAHHVAFLGDQLVDAQLDLAVMTDVTPEEAPPLADMPLPERHEFLPVTHTARSRAAVSSSPHSPVDVSPAARASAQPQAAAPPSRRTR
ncbi:hypothetical protein Sgleb_59990 [Streptomyces glebosus]|uniref:Uncharacterized protein n=1 Tax=Streptomyces glebosus TaxID=249580 RepID=A0A640T4J9_9ACTN|nr:MULTISPECIES: hypothetical protein [Streptomyces]KOG50567.1 hypothetical protein ADK74_00510 [Streptomyces decoyicus]QZY15151.1 hypothetical protein K7C20_07715 [Streptomyces decoyicus]GFE17952.1 hypothetical protein Sgleb_59990 [Streptomyces glebosus]GHG46913.1 hypothetical protein GCM10010513_03010 [Streptomyces glebosus]